MLLEITLASMDKHTNIYKPFPARLEEVIIESPLIKTFVLNPEKDFSFKTGQFIELTLNGIGEAPFTPSSSPLVKDKIDITIMKAGYVTEKIHQLEPGEVLGIKSADLKQMIEDDSLFGYTFMRAIGRTLSQRLADTRFQLVNIISV
jgi:predicted ferric reductase